MQSHQAHIMTMHAGRLRGPSNRVLLLPAPTRHDQLLRFAGSFSLANK